MERYSPHTSVLERMPMFTGFREFNMRGNVIDPAVAVVIGAAFGTVITSFVADILIPLLGLIGIPTSRPPRSPSAKPRCATA